MRKDPNTMVFKTPLGWAGVSASETGISMLVLPKKDKKAVERELLSSELGVRSESNKLKDRRMLDKTVKLLQKYFSGGRVSFDLPVDMRYHTTFQQAVWKAAAVIPLGETRSYAWVAKKIRKPGAARAVGQALGANPVPIIIP